MIKDAKSQTIENIFGKNGNDALFYKIPPYQRAYAWKTEQWEELFNDINDNEQGYFLGSIICISSTESEPLEVVDGQQRLTTISLLLMSILSVIKEYNERKPDEGVLEFSKNKKWVLSANTLEELLSQEGAGNKLTLSIQNQNNIDYEHLLDKLINSSKKEAPKNLGNRQISRAYDYFRDRLLKQDAEERDIFSITDIFTLLSKIVSAYIVKIEVKDPASAFTLFESLNNRGTPLTPIDLIKNTIIGKKGGNPEQTNTEWQKIVENIVGYDDQVRFLRHYYHAFKSRKEVEVSPYTKATKSNIIKIYTEHIKRNVDFIFQELIDKSKIYGAFVQPENIEQGIFQKYKDQLISLKRLGVAPAYTLLLNIFERFPKEQLSGLLAVVENWFIRRHLTNFPATNALDQMFQDLIGSLTEVIDYSEVARKIETFLTGEKYYKSDDAFKTILESGGLYEVNANAVRCLLVKLETSKRTDETKVDFWALTDAGKLVWSIEHILPQNPTRDSPWTSTFSKDERESNMHRLGNLTLTCYNSNLSNSSFESKISAKKEGKDIGLHSKNVSINEFLLDKKDWTVSDITSRSEVLAKEIISLLTFSTARA